MKMTQYAAVTSLFCHKLMLISLKDDAQLSMCSKLYLDFSPDRTFVSLYICHCIFESSNNVRP